MTSAWRARIRTALFTALAAAVLACESQLSLIEPGSVTDDSTPGGTFQRATLAVTVSVAGEDSAVASLIGFDRGVLPGAEVRIVRRGTSGSEQTQMSDADGLTRFEELLPGDFDVSVFRLLTPEEIATLAEEGEAVTAFREATKLVVEAPSTEATVEAVTNRDSSSLVISEISITLPRLGVGIFYNLGHFIELYNNSDTTIYLDKKVIVKGFFFGHWDSNETFNCESMRPWREDPNGIWTQRLLEAFPGGGRDFPLAPGEAVVVATDAIDHREVHSGLPDLTGADFEFVGSSDVDNPGVPNMVSLGKVWANETGHGLFFAPSGEVLLVAEPLDVGSLLKEDVPGALDPEHWRIPKNKILDVAALVPTPAIIKEIEDSGFFGPICRWVHENFDRAQAQLVDIAFIHGYQRRVLRARPDGSRVLQRTKVSALDFFSGPFSPGFIRDE